MSSTGQALGYVVGAVAGYFTGGASYVLTGAAIGGAVGAALDPPKGPNLQGPRLSDLSQQGASYGTPIPRVYGSVATHGNIFWIENNSLKETSRTSSSGGKGGGGGSSTTTYQYSATFALGLCEGPIAGVRRIWINGDLIYNAGAADLDTIIASNSAAQGFTVYSGSETQQPDPRMQATLGVANTPAFRGLAYIVFHDLELEKYGNTLAGAQVKVEVVQSMGDIWQTQNLYQVQDTLGGYPVGVWYDGTDAYCFFWRNYNQPGPTNVVRVMRARENVITEQVAEFAWGPNYYSSSVPNGQCNRPIVCSISGTTLSVFEVNGSYQSMALPASVSLRCVAVDGLNVYAMGDSATKIYVFYAGSYITTISLGIQGNHIGYTDRYLWVSAETYGSQQTMVIVRIDRIDYSTYTFSFPLGGFLAHYPMVHGISDDDVRIHSLSAIYRLSNGDLSVYSNNSFRNPADSYLFARYFSMRGDVAYMACNRNNTDPAEKNLLQVSYKTISINGIALSDVVLSETLNAGVLSAPDIDASQLTDTVHGYRVTKTGAIRSSIEPLQGAYPFDVVQSGYRIRYVRRGVSSSVSTITEDSLDARSNAGQRGSRLIRTREMDSQLPVRVNLTFIDSDREYDVGEQYAERLNTDSVNVQSTEFPVVMTATEAQQKAEVLLYLYWLERYEFSFTLPPTYRHLEPADIVTLTANGGQFILRLTRIQYHADGSLSVIARPNDSSTYVSQAIGSDGITSPGIVSIKGRSVYELLDIPIVLEENGTYGFAVAMGGYSANWPAGILYRSTDSGSSWSDINTFVQPSTFGIARSALSAPADARMMDKAGALSLSIYGGNTLSSVTEAALLNGANHFAYGADGRWEIMAAQTITLQSDGSYVLTDLLRGRFGTEWAMGIHAANDKIVLLSSSTLQWCGSSLNAIGVPMDYRAITSGAALDSETSRAFTYRGVNLECLSPVWINGNRHPASNDWTLTWLRRTRVGGEWRDYIDAPLGEASEAYEVEIYTSAAYATLKRTITGLTTASATYTSAQQVADFGSNQATLYVKVYQLSANVGRGYPLTTSITR